MKNLMTSICRLLRELTTEIQKEKNLEGKYSALVSSIIQLLIKLGGFLERKVFIPGKSRENEQAREFFIKSNTYGILLLVSQTFPNLCKKDIEEFQTNISKKDTEMHLEVQDSLSPEKMTHSEHLINCKNGSLTQISHRFSLALDAFETSRSKIISQRHTTEVRSFRSRRQSAFPIIRK